MRSKRRVRRCSTTQRTVDVTATKSRPLAMSATGTPSPSETSRSVPTIHADATAA